MYALQLASIIIAHSEINIVRGITSILHVYYRMQVCTIITEFNTLSPAPESGRIYYPGSTRVSACNACCVRTT